METRIITVTLRGAAADRLREAQCDAADPKKQIGILADLYAVPRAEICRVLGIDEPKPKKLRTYDKSVKDAVVRAVLLDNEPRGEVAERFGVPIGTVNAWVAKAKKQQKEFLSYGPESHDKGHEPDAESAEAVTEHGTPAPSGLDPAKIARELDEGVEGLRVFLESFAGIDLFTRDQWECLDVVLGKAEGFAAGMKTAVKLMEVGK